MELQRIVIVTLGKQAKRKIEKQRKTEHTIVIKGLLSKEYIKCK